jgi:hypothetical protein
MNDKPISNWLAWATAHTQEAANLSDNQTRRKRDRAMREIARSILPKGYVIATPAELKERYGELSGMGTLPDNKDNIFIWCLLVHSEYKTSWGKTIRGRYDHTINFAPVRKCGKCR